MTRSTKTHSPRATRRALAAVSAVAAAGLLLSACSSGSEPAATASATAATTAATMAPSDTATAAAPDTTSPAALACTAYFELDLLNSNYAGGAVAQGDLTEEEVKANFKASLKQLVAQAKLAVADGTADPKLVKNAKKMKKEVNSLAKKDNLSDLSKQQKAKFAKQSMRVQKACMAAGFDLPADNVTARTAANL